MCIMRLYEAGAIRGFPVYTWLGIPHSPNGAKKARKKTVFS